MRFTWANNKSKKIRSFDCLLLSVMHLKVCYETCEMMFHCIRTLECLMWTRVTKNLIAVESKYSASLVYTYTLSFDFQGEGCDHVKSINQ